MHSNQYIKLNSFSYYFLGKEFNGNFIHSKKGYGWIQVFFNDQAAINIRAVIRTADNELIWIQDIQHNEPDFPHDLVQALGEGLKNAGRLAK
jgi:hypothetical protein